MVGYPGYSHSATERRRPEPVWPESATPLLYHALLVTAFSGPQSRFGNKLLGIRAVCPQHGTAVLKRVSSPSLVDLYPVGFFGQVAHTNNVPQQITSPGNDY